MTKVIALRKADPVAGHEAVPARIVISVEEPLPDFGGWVVDTPGIRQFDVWDIMPEEVEGYFVEFRPLVPLCAFPDCTHTHEQHCAVKEAVENGLVSERRYVSYLGLFTGKMQEREEE